MKLLYCTHSICNPGGMERVLLNKISYLVKHTDWEIVLITTDQKNRPPFYSLPEKVKWMDLGINYSDDNGKPIWQKVVGYLRRKRLHKHKLTDILKMEKPDVMVSLYPSESSFYPSLKDGSKKVLELHFCKLFRLQYNRKGVLGVIDRWRTKQDEKLVRKFDKFVVLTEEDKINWGDWKDIVAIPNAALSNDGGFTSVINKRVIAVGRLDYQKGFDRLIDAWKIIQQNKIFQDWRLDIFGQGEWKEMLQDRIEQYGLQNTAFLNLPSTAIYEEYRNSSLIVMTSNYEGFGMVLVEAMSCGVPAVAFDCKCGPKDIIRHGENGLLVKNGDIQGVAEAMMKLMEDEELRRKMSLGARQVTETYSEEVVMKQWVDLFEGLVRK